MVIAVNGWMNHPTGFQLQRRQSGRRASRSRRCSATATSGTSSCTCTSPATWSPASSSPAPTPSARLRGRWGRYERTALAIPLAVAALAAPVQVLVGDWNGREVARCTADQARRLRGARRDDRGRARAPPRLVQRRPRRVRDPDPAAALAARLPRPERDRRRASTRCRRTSGRPSTSSASPSRRWSGSAPCSRCSASSTSSFAGGASGCRSRSWFYRALVLAGPLSVVALICGWVTTEVGRQPWVVYHVMRTSAGRHRRRRHPGRLRDARARLPRARARGRLDPPSPRPRAARSGTRHRRGAADVHLYELPLLFALIGLAFYAVLAGPTSAPASGSCTAGKAPTPTRSATTRTTRWGRSGRRTTSGSSSC